jgi:hypothetical protein
MQNLSRKMKFFGALALLAALVGASLIVAQSSSAGPKQPKDDSGFSVPGLGF